MAIEIKMPQLSDTMSEGRILAWLKNEGDEVSRGDTLAEVATDKADLEIEAFHEGKLTQIAAPAGATVKVGQVIALLQEAGAEEVEEIEKHVAEAEPTPPPQQSTPQAAEVQTAAPRIAAEEASSAAPPAAADERMKISPLARNLAEEAGVDVSLLLGSGEGGRIMQRDVQQYLEKRGITQAKELPREEQSEAAPLPAETTVSGSQPLSRMRLTIASRMAESASTIPHFFMSVSLRADELYRIRETLKVLPAYEGLTYNHLLVKAAALALRQTPRLNCSFKDGVLIEPQSINIGVVTALPDGLLIPVIRNADLLPLSELVSDAVQLIQRAKAGRPKSDDLLGGTFSVSNVGKYNIDAFTAIINPGQGAILALGSLHDEAVVEAGEIKPGKIIKATLSADHRIIDGVTAAQFLSDFKRFVEQPVLILA